MNHPKITTNHVRNCAHCQHVIANVNTCVKDKTFLRMARKLTNNHTQAEDLVQITSQKLIDKSHHYTQQNFKAFAKVMMNRIFLNQVRSTKTDSSKKDRIYSIHTLNQPQHQFNTQLEQKILIDQIYTTLSESEKDLFMLLYQGYKHHEISNVLKINPNTCHGRIRALKQKIRNKFSR